jgi:hypothetical protein
MEPSVKAGQKTGMLFYVAKIINERVVGKAPPHITSKYLVCPVVN